jgi:RNA polymerase sigma-70 factor, ECF subfamily
MSRTDEPPPSAPLMGATEARARGTSISSVRRAQRGDAEAFEALYRENAGRIHALCLRMSGDASRAAELTQDVFVHAWRKMGQFRGDALFSTWLRRVAVNFVLNALKSERRREARVHATDDLEMFDRGHSMPPVETRIELENAVALLPPGARRVFVLHDMEGYRHKDIAEMLGVAEGTVKAQLHRARRLLREALVR